MATALPPPFDLQAALNWDRDQIMAKAAQLAGGDQEAEATTQDADQTNQEAEGVIQDPRIQEEQVVDPAPSSSAIQVEDEVYLARSEVPTARGTQIESTAEEEGDIVQEKDPAMLQVLEIEGAQTDTVAEGLGGEAAGQGEHPEEEGED